MQNTQREFKVIGPTRFVYRCCHLACLILIALGFLTACATSLARRDARLSWDGKTILPRAAACDHAYAVTDDLIWQEMQNSHTNVSSRKALNKRVESTISSELIAGSVTKPCWEASYENHQNLPAVPGDPPQAPGYDLFYAEFDDQGERTDVAHNGVPFARSQVAMIESRLGSLMEEEVSAGGGLNIVLFTHGWHGNADATNDYSVWFKAILEQITELERSSRRTVCWSSRQKLVDGGESIDRQHKLQRQRAVYACSPKSSEGAFKERRTVGIEIAWRGDSEVVPLFSWANFWDRKGAAQTAARGAVVDFMARLHKFYVVHSCHSGKLYATEQRGPCDAVHLLTIGHSFGALIDYHSLSDDLATGILADSAGRAYGFGDMTVLLNPAFEGERESTLIDASINHPAYPSELVAKKSEQQQEVGRWPSYAQMPTLVTLQSQGDWATHYAFPAARFVTGAFENTTGTNEYSRSLHASGWVSYYFTHRLVNGVENGKDECLPQGAPLDWYCPFDLEGETNVVHPLSLSKASAHEWPAFAPFWTVQVQKAIMKDHDDISNPAIVRFIGLLFRAAYEQEEVVSEHPSPIPHTQ